MALVAAKINKAETTQHQAKKHEKLKRSDKTSQLGG